MTEQQTDSASTSRDSAWGAALAALLLTVIIGLGATFSDAPGDRAGGTVLLVVGAIGATTLVCSRKSFRALARSAIIAGSAQAIAASIMIKQRWGAASVILAITALLVAAWAGAAFLFHREGRDKARTSHT